jgi:nucleoside-diphosphate-sugar epimerase
MIVGNGLIAKAFHENYANNDDVLIFASGVSNSSNTDPKEFLREKTLLESHLAEQKKIVYFSTCSSEDPSLGNNPYILHKLQMEELVKGVDDYLIFRLPQLAGKTDNPNTLLNFLYRKIKSQERFDLYTRASKNIIDIDDVVKIATYVVDKNLKKNQIINIAFLKNCSVSQLVKYFEDIIGLKAIYNLVDKGEIYYIENDLANNISKELKIIFDDKYIENILKKYFKT